MKPNNVTDLVRLLRIHEADVPSGIWDLANFSCSGVELKWWWCFGVYKLVEGVLGQGNGIFNSCSTPLFKHFIEDRARPLLVATASDE